ncbi:MAG: aldo/keto reductase [Sedimenticolaceae bacterium]
MNYRVLGRTGLRVSEITFGCGSVGGMFVRGTHQDQVQAMSRALELGINYFDTAPAYGDGRSETNLGLVLAELRPQAIVATKVHLRDADLQDIMSAVQRSLEGSPRRLGRDSVDVLQFHTHVAMQRGGAGWLETVNLRDVLGKGGVADAFDAVRSQGLVRFLGFTGLGETDALHQVIESDRFDLVQVYYNILNPSAGLAMPPGFKGQDFRRLIDIAAGSKVGVVAIRVLAGGVLGGAEARTGLAMSSVGEIGIPGSEYEVDELRAKKLGFLLMGDVKSLPQAAIRFALMQRGVSTALVGFSNLRQIEEAATCSGKGQLSRLEMGRLRELWASDFRN